MSALLLRTESIGFAEAWRLQRSLASARRAGRIPDVLWLLEHPPVYTYGRNARREDLFATDAELVASGASIHHIDRGGQMTWHGPGQCTAYAIWRLSGGVGVRTLVTALLDAAREATGLPDAEARLDMPGVYRDGRKLASVGIRVAERVSTHGVAVNRDCDLSWFSRMSACGMPDVAATSIAAEGGDAARAAVEGRLARALGQALDVELVPASLDELAAMSTG